jgi:adenosylcobinamide-phosphate synthase
MAATVQGIFLAGYLIAHTVCSRIHPGVGMAWAVFVGYSCLALKDLFIHTNRVTRALEADDLPGARESIAMVVGRDVRFLDEAGVVRAAVETLAENFVDGFLSPVFWYLIGGVLGSMMGIAPVATGISMMLVFKVASTLDSMVGYKEGPFLTFGWAGARLDDGMNFVPARLSLGILFVGAWICRLNPVEGIRTALKDRLKHESPNSAHAESFAAGALHVRLGGPTVYPGGLKEKPWLGQGNPDPVPADIRKMARLLTCSAWATVMIPVSVLILHYV